MRRAPILRYYWLLIDTGRGQLDRLVSNPLVFGHLRSYIVLRLCSQDPKENVMLEKVPMVRVARAIYNRLEIVSGPFQFIQVNWLNTDLFYPHFWYYRTDFKGPVPTIHLHANVSGYYR